MAQTRDGSRTAACSRSRRALRPLLVALCFAGLCGTLVAQEPLYTSNPKFRIPFQFDAEEMTRLGAVEVQLHVSTDRGRSWQLADSVTPSAQKFAFEAPANGEFRFAVRTIDVQRKPHPPGPLQPGLIVVVDDLDPVLKLNVAAGATGGIEVSWDAIDDHLDINTLRLEYLDPGLSAWQLLRATPAENGTTRLNVPATGELLVRGAISDRAGNSTLANASLNLSRTTTRPAQRREEPDFREPIAERTEPQVSEAKSTSPIILPNMGHDPVPPTTPDGWSHLTRPASVQNRTDTTTAPAPTGPSSAAASSTQPSLGLPLDARRVNSRNFRIGYSVQDVGPSGVGSVDLYITENGGGKWFHYGSDPDRQSPLDVVVPRDGAYGFSIRVRNGIGIVADPPQPGESPEMVIVVDQTPPTARLSPLQQESLGASHSIRISWTVQDDRLADRPVALFSSGSPDGPWEPITGWMENTGRYNWVVGPGIPSSVFVRLEARDSAGNVTSAATDRPLLVDTSRPTARMLDIESVHAPH
jgi:hypothetical protein